MKKFKFILPFIFIVSCNNHSFYTKSFCDRNVILYKELFTICMQGQRHTTGTDDADDFAKACDDIASRQSLINCNNVLYVTLNGWDGYQVKLSEPCKDTKDKNYIKACKEYGFDYENRK